MNINGWISKNFPFGVVVFATYIITWISSNTMKIYWTDEIFSIWTSGGGGLTWGESLDQVASGRDGMMAAFYAQSSLWENFLVFSGLVNPSAIWSSSEIWLRVPSLLWTLSGFGILYLFLKKNYGGAGAGVGLAIGMLCTVGAGQEMQWVRAYAPMVALVAITVVLMGGELGKTRVILVYLSCLLLSLFHPYGFLYAGAIVGVGAIFEFWQGRRILAMSLLGAMVLPSLVILLNLKRLVLVKNLGGEGGMWPTPGTDSLLFSLAPLSNPLLVAFALMFCGAVFLRGELGREHLKSFNRDEGGVTDRKRFSWVVGSLVGVPVVIWLFSQWESFFIIRYFSPSIVIITVFSCWVVSRVLGNGRGWVGPVAVALICLTHLSQGLIVGEDRSLRDAFNKRLKGLDDDRFLVGAGGETFPLILEDLDLFLPRVFYKTPNRYFFPIRDLDPEESNFRDKALAQNLVLAHERSYAETGGAVGVDPEAILDLSKLKDLTKNNRKIFMIPNRTKGTGEFVGTELEKMGWKKSMLIPDYLIMWENNNFSINDGGMGGASTFDLWYGTQ